MSALNYSITGGANMIAELGGLQLQQLPKLAQYILPADKNSDSVLECNLKTMMDGQMDLSIVLSRSYGESAGPDEKRLVEAMKGMAMVYEELNRIKYEVLAQIYRKGA